ncbi:Aquaporin NIP1-2 [Apostasia shenzhenica]|uniref:Aquaporin NIP1-2 n=1 Tax=Apostasia shenzhenica TaxID=1088818 RepID=A0A2I0A5E8_9ASPA|nr:Aquaporin NIP1-2 [Apostasia shenzhenica]
MAADHDQEFSASADQHHKINSYLITSQKLLSELLSAFLLVFIGCGSEFAAQRVDINLVGVALAWSVALTTIIYTLGHVSSHVNPIVTVALAAVGQFPWKQVPGYVTAHVLGSTFACLLLRLLFNGERMTVMLSLPVGEPPASNLNVMAWEAIVAFILMLSISGSLADPRASKGFGGIAIGGALFAGVIVAGTKSGGSMNPAKSLAAAIVVGKFEKLWIYIISPIVGAVLASSFYAFLQLPANKTMIMRKDKSPRGGACSANTEHSLEIA